MNRFKLGTNFNDELLSLIEEKNNSFENKVTELYGSTRFDAALTARPDFRLPEVNDEQLKNYIAKAKKIGVNFNYTLNSINPYGSKSEFVKNIGKIKELIEKLTEFGVYRITIANPMLLEVIKNIDKHPLIEASTIMHIDTITQIKYLYETYGVTKICANINKNRNFVWLEKAAKYCNDNGIILELMANEFCAVGGNNYSTHCIYRDSCYICHSTNHDLSDALSLDSYPMKQCTNSRNQNGINWLRSKFIRPEDLQVYNNIGIFNFKLTGRTATNEYLSKILHAYMSESFEGNLLELWKPLESIISNKDESFTTYNIPNKKLCNFIKIWSEKKKDCDLEVCGETCKYCENWYNMQSKLYNGESLC